MFCDPMFELALKQLDKHFVVYIEYNIFLLRRFQLSYITDDFSTTHKWSRSDELGNYECDLLAKPSSAMVWRHYSVTRPGLPIRLLSQPDDKNCQSLDKVVHVLITSGSLYYCS